MCKRVLLKSLTGRCWMVQANQMSGVIGGLAVVLYEATTSKVPRGKSRQSTGIVGAGREVQKHENDLTQKMLKLYYQKKSATCYQGFFRTFLGDENEIVDPCSVVYIVSSVHSEWCYAWSCHVCTILLYSDRPFC